MPPFLGGFGQETAASDEEQETPGGRRVGLVEGRVHHGAYGEVEKRQQPEQEEPDGLQQQGSLREHAPVGKEHEGWDGG